MQQSVCVYICCANSPFLLKYIRKQYVCIVNVSHICMVRGKQLDVSCTEEEGRTLRRLQSFCCTLCFQHCYLPRTYVLGLF